MSNEQPTTVESSAESRPFERMRGLPQILLCGEQILPNVLGMLELGATRYVAVTTDRESSERLDRALAWFNCAPFDDPIRVPAYDIGGTEAVAREAGRRWAVKHPRFVLNYTGGTKPMALGMIAALDDSIVERLYTDRGRLLYSYRPGGDVTGSLATRLDVEGLLRANGMLPFSLRNDPGASSPVYYAFKPEPPDAIVRLARAIGSDYANYHAEVLRLREGSTGSGAAFDHQSALTLLRRYGAYPGDKQALKFANGGWLEAFVFDVLDQARGRLGLTDLRWGLTLKRKVGADDTDFDVAFAAHNGLYAISCKTEAKSNVKDEMLPMITRIRMLGGAFGGGALVQLRPVTDPSVAMERDRAASFRPPFKLLGSEVIGDPELLVEAAGEMVR